MYASLYFYLNTQDTFLVYLCSTYALKSPTSLCGCSKGIWHLFDSCHNFLPRLVYLKKHLGFSRELPLDVWGHKDTL